MKLIFMILNRYRSLPLNHPTRKANSSSDQSLSSAMHYLKFIKLKWVCVKITCQKEIYIHMLYVLILDLLNFNLISQWSIFLLVHRAPAPLDLVLAACTSTSLFAQKILFPLGTFINVRLSSMLTPTSCTSCTFLKVNLLRLEHYCKIHRNISTRLIHPTMLQSQ